MNKLKGVQQMLRSTKDMQGYALLARDGEIGDVHEFYFDDHDWAIRYLVADTGGWLTGRRVLIAPEALGEPDWANERLPVALTKQQIEDSPGVETERPVSRQHESALRDYYGWPYYWDSLSIPYAWQMVPPVAPVTPVQPTPRALDQEQQPDLDYDPTLRSTREVQGYYIQGSDGEIGHVDSFLVNEEDWKIHYIVVDTGNWLPGRKVLLAHPWINRIDWQDGKVHVALTREEIEASPPYDPSQPVEREYEGKLYGHYDRVMM